MRLFHLHGLFSIEVFETGIGGVAFFGLDRIGTDADAVDLHLGIGHENRILFGVENQEIRIAFLVLLQRGGNDPVFTVLLHAHDVGLVDHGLPYIGLQLLVEGGITGVDGLGGGFCRDFLFGQRPDSGIGQAFGIVVLLGEDQRNQHYPAQPDRRKCRIREYA